MPKRISYPTSDSSPQEVGRIALANAAASFPTMRGKAEVALARSITNRELAATRLGGIVSEGLGYPDDVPLVVVILRGSFDVSGMPGMANVSDEERAKPARFIVYIYDMSLGAATTAFASYDGTGLGGLLNDSRLPEQTVVLPEEKLPAPEVGAPDLYSDIAPTAPASE